jgi:hypothetical protein
LELLATVIAVQLSNAQFLFNLDGDSVFLVAEQALKDGLEAFALLAKSRQSLTSPTVAWTELTFFGPVGGFAAFLRLPMTLVAWWMFAEKVLRT